MSSLTTRSATTLASQTPTVPALRRWVERVGWPELTLIGLLLIAARRPEAIMAAEFSWEEANAFYVPTFFLDPVAQLAEPWGGTLQVIPRLAYMLLRAVPVYWAPLAENLLAFGSLLAVAAFVASHRLAPVVPDRRVRLGLAGLLLVLPAQRDVLGALMNSQWYLGLWLALLPMTAKPVTSAGRWMERALVAAASLTGPFAALLTPVYVWRLGMRRSRHDAWLAAIVLAGGTVQVAVILATGRAEIGEPRPFELALVTLWLHAIVVPVVGERLSSWLAASAIPAPILALGAVALGAALAFVARRSLPAGAAPLVYGAVVIAASGVAIHGGANVWPPGTYERYFLAAAALVVGIVVAGLIRRTRLAMLLAALVGLGIATDFRLDPYPAQGWEQNHACIGSAERCVVPVWPPGYEVRWPGAGGTYDLPEHVDP